MKSLLIRFFNIIRGLYFRIRRASVERKIRKRFIIAPQRDVRALLWKKKYDSNAFWSIIDYKDENWDQVVHLELYMFLHSLGLYYGEKRQYNPIVNNDKVYFSTSGHLIVSSCNKPNDWIYLTTYKKQFRNVRLSVSISFLSVFTEFQIAFRHHSLYERLRFRIVDGKKIVAEVVTKGLFCNPIGECPIVIVRERIYKIEL